MSSSGGVIEEVSLMTADANLREATPRNLLSPTNSLFSSQCCQFGPNLIVWKGKERLAPKASLIDVKSQCKNTF